MAKQQKPPAADEPSDYVPPPVVDVQAMMQHPRRVPQPPTREQVEASHEATVEQLVADERRRRQEQGIPAGPDAAAAQASHEASMKTIHRNMTPLRESRAEVIGREERHHNENLSLIMAEMNGETRVYSGGNAGEE